MGTLPLGIRNSPFHRIGDSYGHFFDYGHFMGRSAFDDSWMTRPLANIVEHENEYKIELTMPGFSRDEIDIEINDDLLRISAHRKTPEKGKFLHREVPDKQAERVFEIAGEIDQDRIHAKLDKGILTIFMPHKEGVQHVVRHVVVE